MPNSGASMVEAPNHAVVVAPVGPTATVGNRVPWARALRTRFAGVGRADLARRVRWVSDEDGDGAGYDIESYSAEGRPRLIEVKTTNGWERTPFCITRNEIAVADNRSTEWCLLRLWNFIREPRAFELHPPLNAHVALIATSFEARFH